MHRKPDNEEIIRLCASLKNDAGRLMDIASSIQRREGWLSPEAIDTVAACLSLPRVRVAEQVSFYDFLSTRQSATTVIRLGTDIMDEFHGGGAVRQAFERELGIPVGQTTRDGKITLEEVSFIGVPDQAPAIMVNEQIITAISAEKVPALLDELKAQNEPPNLASAVGDGNNAHPLVSSMVRNNIRKTGPVILSPFERGAALAVAKAKGRENVLTEIRNARLRGRGGAGFPAGMKWEFALHAGREGQRWVIGNADEGEPGTFKDRVILTERPDLLFEGMTLCGYAIGATNGNLYLRKEYEYLHPFLEHVLRRRRDERLLGANCAGIPGFTFDIRIQLGAGAYICGEESALISSCEGKRGDPKTRPPFPVQKGYRNEPTVVNNVETLCCAARIVEKGAAWFTALGSRECPGTKLMSVSGDCGLPGVFEVPFGTKLDEILAMADAQKPRMVNIGGASGTMVAPSDFNRTIGYNDLSTGGAVMVFGSRRDPLRIVTRFMAFFREESCGYCTPCRVGTVLLHDVLERISGGSGSAADLSYIEELASTVKFASRCGLGQAAPNVLLAMLDNFRDEFERRLVVPPAGLQASFSLDAALADAEAIAGRRAQASQEGDVHG